MMSMDAPIDRPTASRTMLVDDLKQRVEQRKYRVDCNAVAEAFLARHSRWEKPLSGPRPSGNRTDELPEFTRPTGVVPGNGSGEQTSSS